MPSMVRPQGKATQIALSILGTAPNASEKKKSKKRQKIDERLTALETSRAK